MKKNKTLIIVFVILCMIISSFKIKNMLLSRTLKETAEHFYTDLYYKNLDDENKKVILSKFEKNGLKLDLNTLIEYNGKLEKKFKNCNKNLSYAEVLPKKPYSKDSFSVKVYLDCK